MKDFIGNNEEVQTYTMQSAESSTNPQGSQTIMVEKWLLQDRIIVLNWMQREMIPLRHTKEYKNFKRFFPDVKSVDEEMRNFTNSGYKICKLTILFVELQ